MVLPWIFGIVAVVGAGFLLLSEFVGEVAEVSGDIMEGLDGMLEGVGIDLIPDALWDHETGGIKGIGCSSIAAFMTGFGAVGLISSINDDPAFVSILWGLFAGVSLGVIYIGVTTFIARQQSNSIIQVSDIIGLKGSATIDSKAGEIGQVAVVIRGTMKAYPAVEENGAELHRNDPVTITKLQGGRLYVKKDNTPL